MRPLILVLLLCAPLPVIFVFHGHGGNMNNAYRLGIQRHWPEAWVVCPQGLPASTARDPEDKRSGWQPNIGENDDFAKIGQLVAAL